MQPFAIKLCRFAHAALCCALAAGCTPYRPYIGAPPVVAGQVHPQQSIAVSPGPVLTPPPSTTAQGPTPTPGTPTPAGPRLAGAPTGLSLRNIGPTQATLGATVTYNLEFNNNSNDSVPGVLVSEGLIEGLTYRSSTPNAKAAGGRIEWELGNVPPGESRKVEVTFQVERGGVFNLCATARTADGKSGQSCATTTVVTPALEVRVSTVGGFQSAVVGQKVTFQIQITNRGTIAATKLIIRDEFDAGLEHEEESSPIERDLDELAPGESKVIHVTLQVVKAGKLCNRVEVSNAEGVRANNQACVTAVAPVPPIPQQPPPTQQTPIQPPPAQQTPTNPPPRTNPPAQADPRQPEPAKTSPIVPPLIRSSPPPRTPANPPNTNTPAPRTTPDFPNPVQRANVSLKVTGPATQEIGGMADFFIEIINTGEIPLTNLVVTDRFSPNLDPVQATDGYVWDGNDLVWKAPTWKIAALDVGKSLRLQLNCKCLQAAAKACNQVIVTAQEGVTDTQEACLEIRNHPSQLSMTVADLRDFVPVGKEVTYDIVITNNGKGPDRNVSLVAILPEEVSLVKLATQGPLGTKFTPEGRNVRFFPPVPEIAAGKTLTYKVTVRAEKAGEVLFRVHVNSAGTKQLLVGEATTTITAN